MLLFSAQVCVLDPEIFGGRGPDPARPRQPEKIRAPTLSAGANALELDVRRGHDRDRGGLENRTAATRYRDAACGRVVLAARSCRGPLLPENLSPAGDAPRRIFRPTGFRFRRAF